MGMDAVRALEYLRIVVEEIRTKHHVSECCLLFLEDALDFYLAAISLDAEVAKELLRGGDIE